jgi:putative cardiolipin synthase
MRALRHHPFHAIRRSTGGISALLLCASLLTGCALPSLENRTESTSLTPAQAASTDLGRAVGPALATHAGLAGIYPLSDAHMAFAARMDLIRSAQRTLDIQYYIWRNDLTGTLLLEEIHEAADRGVRVRLLLDDLGIPSSLDPTLAALEAHPNIEVRLFNPFVVRKPKFIGFLTDFPRANRRMHNKSLTADSTATILGGRNIGDEYFDATDGIVFSDLDVLAVGPAAADVARDFDRYWASASSYPVERILPQAGAGQLDVLASKAQAIERDPAATAYMEALRGPHVIQKMLDNTLPFHDAHDQRRPGERPAQRAAGGTHFASDARSARRSHPGNRRRVAVFRAGHDRHAVPDRPRREGHHRARADQCARSDRCRRGSLRLREAARRTA